MHLHIHLPGIAQGVGHSLPLLIERSGSLGFFVDTYETWCLEENIDVVFPARALGL